MTIENYGLICIYLARKVKPDAYHFVDFHVMDIGNGPEIVRWDSSCGPKPLDVMSFETEYLNWKQTQESQYNSDKQKWILKFGNPTTDELRSLKRLLNEI